MRMRRGVNVPLIVLEVFLIAAAAIVLMPLYFIITATLKTKEEAAASPFAFPTEFTLEHYVNVWQIMRFPTTLGNTALVTVCSVCLLILFGSMAAYPLGRRKEKVYDLIYLLFIAGIMVPFQLAMVPLYRLVQGLDLVNTYHGAILIYTALNTPFTVFLYTGFIKQSPRELEEAAMIDGCSIFRAFWLTVFPILKPVTATVTVLTALNVWNDFLIPLLFLQEPSKRTLTIELYTFVGQYITDWTMLFPGLVLSVTPLIILYVFLQKFIIKGMAAGSIKG